MSRKEDSFNQQKEIRHGLQYLPRDKQPSMYDILSWEHDPLRQKTWLLKMQPEYREPKLTQPQIYEKPSRHLIEAQKNNFSEHHQPSKHLKPHQIKFKLYDYGGNQHQEVKGQAKTGGKTSKKKQNAKREEPKLNAFDSCDKRQIEIRKANIKDFRRDTRELPDSAFTTYFGKPAFAHYGFAADEKSIAKHKSHSVMPHAGQNHPQHTQSHPGALTKANVINIQSRIPRKPTNNPPLQKCSVRLNQYYNVEIVEPDLVNEVRFSNEDRQLKPKVKTPTHKDLNYLPKRVYPPPLEVGSKNPKKQKIRAKTEEKEDGLAFMGRREKFMKDLSEKKKMQNRLAYKVTQCYPLSCEKETEANSTLNEEKWKQIRPAGVSSARQLSAQNFFITR